MTDHARNLATVNAVYSAFGRGDVAAILDHMADDVAWDHGIRDTQIPYLQPGTGKEHVAAFFAAVGSNLEFTTFEPLVMCTADDTVMVALREAGRNVVTGAPLPEDTAVHIFTFGPDGTIVAFRHVGDWAAHEAAARPVGASASARR